MPQADIEFESPVKLDKYLTQVSTVFDFVFGNSTVDSACAYLDGASNEELSYAETRSLALRIAHFLTHDLGLKPGDCVLLTTANSLHYMAFFLATQASLIVPAFANPLYTSGELDHCVGLSEAKYIFADSTSYNACVQAGAKHNIPQGNVFTLAREGPNNVFSRLSDKTFQPIHLTHQQALTTLSLRLFSSGTTGLPKAVNHTHASICYAVYNLVKSTPDVWGGRDQVLIAYIPMFHIAGLVCFGVLAPWMGYKVVVVQKFDFENVLRLVEKHKVTLLNINPPTALMIVKSPLTKKYDLSSLRTFAAGSAALKEQLQGALEDLLGVPVVSSYGQSEQFVCALDRPLHRRNGSNGCMIAQMKGKIVNGELWVKGPNVFAGYHKNDKANAETFTPDGWMRTGDLIELDERQHIYVTDRMKEIIKSDGYQVSPAELEDILISNPDVADAGVVQQDRPEEATEVAKGFVVLAQGKKPTQEQAKSICDYVAGKVAPYKRIRGGIVFLDEIPKNPAGKILRRELRERKGDKALGAVFRKQRMSHL